MKRILVVDDESAIRKLFIRHLEGRGYVVIEASNGKEGLKRYRENPADLIVTDIVMPEKEGIGMMMELRREFPDLKVIAISGGGLNDPGSYLETAKYLGALHTFTKPLDWPELLTAVDEVLA
jgi:CheY-like chemotaxis protein